MSILTGPEIEKEIEAKRIVLDPYDKNNIGPNSADMRLHKDLRVYADGFIKHRAINNPGLGYGPLSSRVDPENYVPRVLDMNGENETWDLEIPEEGLVLYPGILYLGRTVERVGSDFYVPWFDGRSSIGRLGMHVHVTAGRGDTGWFGTVTLEIHVVHPLRVYAGKRICQASFISPQGELRKYHGRYQDQVDATASRMHLSKEEVEKMNEVE